MTEFLNPRTLEEALDALAADGDDLRVVSGATDVVVWVRDGRMGVSRYLNLSYLGGELRFIREEDGFIEIGALTTLTDLLRSDLIRRHGLALWEAAALFGSVQIRNRATVAGNLGTASPAGDTLPPLLALGAQAVLESSSGVRDVSLEKYMFGPGQTARSSDELITAVRFPCDEGARDQLLPAARPAGRSGDLRGGRSRPGRPGARPVGNIHLGAGGLGGGRSDRAPGPGG